MHQQILPKKKKKLSCRQEFLNLGVGEGDFYFTSSNGYCKFTSINLNQSILEEAINTWTKQILGVGSGPSGLKSHKWFDYKLQIWCSGDNPMVREFM